MGMLIGLGIYWLSLKLCTKKEVEKEKPVLSIAYALQKINIPSILFFLGILLSISAMYAAGVLQATAQALSTHLRMKVLL